MFNFISPHSIRIRLGKALQAKIGKIATQMLRFRFEQGWCLYDESKLVIHEAWDKVQGDDPGARIMDGIRSGRLSLLNWKRHILGHVQNSINSKQQQLDSLQQGVITTASKVEAIKLAKNIDKLREVDDMETVTRLDLNFIEEEVKKCLFSMVGTKALGPDRMPAIFFQNYWNMVKDDLVNAVLVFLNNGIFLKKFNFTHITLIPKVERPICMGQFRLITLCNTVMKVISKALTVRLKNFLP
ncbi:hypothetical protein LIER_17351 [Lithospermum erythrorhizon]|uniref:Reverse transcriptase n=1 Tax=Lithospermum erythrorhizon TaxID=34254 RepID=A0AAV3Q9Z1_LITER